MGWLGRSEAIVYAPFARRGNGGGHCGYEPLDHHDPYARGYQRTAKADQQVVCIFSSRLAPVAVMLLDFSAKRASFFCVLLGLGDFIARSQVILAVSGKPSHDSSNIG